jgi:hypothetical protein
MTELTQTTREGKTTYHLKWVFHTWSFKTEKEREAFKNYWRL